jgi:Mn2+/Fe2+ NRAMP family transporter
LSSASPSTSLGSTDQGAGLGAVVNGVIVVPIMAAMMVVASRPKLMGEFVAARWQRVLGWAATAIMAAAAIAMFFLM